MRARGRIVVVAVALAVLVGVAAGVRSWVRLGPSIAGASALAEAGRFDEAEARLREILRADPDHPGANLLAAQVAIGRPDTSVADSGGAPDPAPALAALDHLGRVRTRDPRAASLAQVCRGKAEHRLGRYDAAEASWLEALRLDPTVGEAGWSLLELYYLEGRPDDARRLALRLHEAEPDRRDRVQLLLELLRQDVQPPAPESLVALFAPIVARTPDDVGPAIALGLALVRTGESGRGLVMLRRTAERRPDRVDAWDAWLSGLDDAGQAEASAEVLGRLPGPIADSPRFARHRARVAQERGDWSAAADGYRRALADSPADGRSLYRLARILRRVGEAAEADRIDRRHRDREATIAESRAVYEAANADTTLGVTPHPDLYRKIADLREALGHPDEALAWHRLVLRDRPKDARSLAAAARLAAERKGESSRPD